jgi:hypothetical protein
MQIGIAPVSIGFVLAIIALVILVVLMVMGTIPLMWTGLVLLLLCLSRLC